MRRLALLLALAAAPAAAQAPRADAERAFALGLALAAEGDTTGAAAAFEAARAGGASAALEHNLARLALARGDVGRARLAAERAYRLDPSAAGVADVLDAARQAAGDAPPTALRLRLDAAVGPLGPLGVVLLALALAALAALAVWQRHRLPGLVVGLAVALAALALGGAAALLAERTALDAVLVESAALRGAPSPDAPEGLRLDAGRLVHAGERRDGWVRLGGGLDGWVPEGAVEAL